jgi:hypothetical protein
VPQGHRREPLMVLIGLVIVAVLMVIAVPRIIRRQM